MTRSCKASKKSRKEGKKGEDLTSVETTSSQTATHLAGDESPKKSKLIPPGVEVAALEGGKAAGGGDGREAKGRETFAGEDFLAATVLDGDFPLPEALAVGLAAGFLSPSSPPLSLPEDLVGAFFTMVKVWK